MNSSLPIGHKSDLPEASILVDFDAYLSLTQEERDDRWAGVLPGTKPESRARASVFLERLLELEHHDLALAASGAIWPLIAAYISRHPGYRAEYEMVRRAIEVRRQPAREDAAFKRAVDGIDKPVWGRDEGKDAGTVQVGTEREYSDRLLLKELEAGNRPKYAPPQVAAAGINAQTVVIHYHSGIARAPESATNPPPPPIDAEFSEEIGESDADS